MCVKTQRPKKPAPPTHVQAALRPPIAVRPTDEVHWDDDYDGWVVHYETSDERVPAEFRAWRAVWWDGHWQPAEV